MGRSFTNRAVTSRADQRRIREYSRMDASAQMAFRVHLVAQGHRGLARRLQSRQTQHRHGARDENLRRDEDFANAQLDSEVEDWWWECMMDYMYGYDSDDEF